VKRLVRRFRKNTLIIHNSVATLLHNKCQPIITAFCYLCYFALVLYENVQSLKGQKLENMFLSQSVLMGQNHLKV